MRGLFPLLFSLFNPSAPVADIEIDTEGLSDEARAVRRFEEAQPISKRNLKKSLGKKNRKNRGKRRSK